MPGVPVYATYLVFIFSSAALEGRKRSKTSREAEKRYYIHKDKRGTWCFSLCEWERKRELLCLHLVIFWATRALSGQATWMLNTTHIPPSGCPVPAWEATIFPRFFTHFPRSLFHQIEIGSNPKSLLQKAQYWYWLKRSHGCCCTWALGRNRVQSRSRNLMGEQTRRRRRKRKKDSELQWQNGYSSIVYFPDSNKLVLL